MESSEIEKHESLEPHIDQVRPIVDKLLSDRKEIKVLDAGCGSRCPYCPSVFTRNEYSYIVGLDESKKQLEENTFVHEKVLGDVEGYQFTERSFDIVVSLGVFEHLDNPLKALGIFISSVKDNGLIVIMTANPFSPKALLAKFSPYRFHLWIYRSILGLKSAGIGENGPFPTVMRFSIAPGSIIRYAHRNNLTVEYIDLFESTQQNAIKKKFPNIRVCWNFTRFIIKVLTMGRIDIDNTDYIIVLKSKK